MRAPQARGFQGGGSPFGLTDSEVAFTRQAPLVHLDHSVILVLPSRAQLLLVRVSSSVADGGRHQSLRVADMRTLMEFRKFACSWLLRDVASIVLVVSTWMVGRIWLRRPAVVSAVVKGAVRSGYPR